MSDPDSMNPPIDARLVRSQIGALAAHLQRSGVSFLPRPRSTTVESLAKRFVVPIANEPPQPDESVTATAANPVTSVATGARSNRTPARPTMRFDSVAPLTSRESNYPGDPLPVTDRQAALDALGQEVAACTACTILASCRTQTVFGEGNPSPRVVFFGEAPGADEDRSGRPFVGKAGQLLTRMIEACKFRRPDVYILNTVKCRPPGNRNPDPDEIEHCRDFYQRQLNLLRPEYIVCLGAISSQELLKTKLSVGRLRGKFHEYFNSKVLVTYHPAYLLRNPDAKKAAWADLQLMLKDAGIEL